MNKPPLADHHKVCPTFQTTTHNTQHKMPKSILTTITLLMMACFAHAERVNIGDYFTINVPRSWKVITNGSHVHTPDDYTVYAAHGSFGVVIGVLNLPAEQTGTIDYKDYLSLTDVELPTLAQINHKTGYTLPIVKKIEVNGIPTLLFKQKDNSDGVYQLTLSLYIADKHFEVKFFYTKETYQNVNNMIDSIKRGTPPVLLPASVPAPAGLAGEEV